MNRLFGEFAITISRARVLLPTLTFLLLSACASRSSVPETAILTDIQEVLEAAAADLEEPGLVESLSDDATELLGELIPSLSLDQNLLEPVEERTSVSTGDQKMSASVFFSSLVLDTEYGVVVGPEVDVEINLSLPSLTIEEIMDTVADIYSLDITRRGNTFLIQPGGLQTRRFTIDYLNVQRYGSSSIQVTSGGGGGGQSGGGQSGGGQSGGG
ncbi:MAG: secretin N-terminal domain-containing protein, partial [Pseudohongiella sp.]|nr:secretin N-terminal domain-containing protein [Pseudohongiella sp.]